MGVIDQYDLVAEFLAQEVYTLWADVDAALRSNSPVSPENPIAPVLLVDNLFKQAWQAHLPGTTPVLQDWVSVLVKLVDRLDANLWSQVYLNSPLKVSPIYDLPAIQARINELGKKLEITELRKASKLRPFTDDMSDEDKEWNELHALIAAYKVLEEKGAIKAYKIYSRGKTPAFTDSQGISRTSSIIDRYLLLRGEVTTELYIDPSKVKLTATVTEQGIQVSGFRYPFISKSGDQESLLRILEIRSEMARKFKETNGAVVLIPRWSSLTCILTK